MLLVKLFIFCCSVFDVATVSVKPRPADADELIKLSQDLLYAVKTGADISGAEARIGSFSADMLAIGLPEDQHRKLFWLNMYNAWYQILADRDKLERPQIFHHRGIKFNGFVLSLDDIEHGILRRYRSKYSFGYLPQLFPDRTIKKLAVKNPDYRIHFALNCGARSCPPIAFYELEHFDDQLDLAARVYLQNESKVDSESGIVYTTRLMEWFSADFGGKRGCLKILSKYLNRDLKNYTVKFRDYDWSDQLMNFGD